VYAFESHQKAVEAWEKGVYDTEVMPFPIGPKYRNTMVQDNIPRADTSLEKLASLKPVFDRKYGSITAGNSSPLNAGANALCLMAKEVAEAKGLKPMATIRSIGFAGVAPNIMGIGPVPSSQRALKAAGLEVKDIDFWEINEAFAGQVLACVEALADDAYCREVIGVDGAPGRIDEDKLNIDGGAIATGHPVGASGARIVLHALKVLERQGGGTAVATLCIGGGQGGAMLLKSKPE